MNPARTRELALALTAEPSVTDTDGETRFAFFLRDLLADWPYFKARPDRIRLVRTVDDERERYAVVAAVGASLERAAAAPAVILTGHYDVVSVENYGPLAPFAFDAEALAPRLVAALEAEAASAAARGERPGDTERRALEDLRSGEFLPGRGLLDMKAGLAAGLAVLEDHAERQARIAESADPVAESPARAAESAGGALVFLAVPDEEGSSRGMLSAVRALPGLLAEWGLDAVAAINLDAAVDQGDGAAGRAAFLGSVGKLHPFSLFVGRPTHAGAPFDGVNPALAAAEFARGLECAPGLFDRPSPAARGPAPAVARPDAGQAKSADQSPEASREPPASPESPAASDVSPPPTILYYRDLRDHYDVTTPAAVFVSANVLTRADGPVQVLDAVSALSGAAMRAAGATLRGRAEAHARSSGQDFSPPDREPRVVPWAELLRLARLADPTACAAAEAKARAASDRMAALAAYAAEAVRLAGLEGPAAVVGLAPPYYPRAALDPIRDAGLVAAVAAAIEAVSAETAATEPGATEPGTGEPGTGERASGAPRIGLRSSFPGISDMSYLYPGDDAEARGAAAEACPFGLDPLPSGFSCPVVNIGPWGREYHQRLERVHVGYAFGVLPELLERTIAELFRRN